MLLGRSLELSRQVSHMGSTSPADAVFVAFERPLWMGSVKSDVDDGSFLVSETAGTFQAGACT